MIIHEIIEKLHEKGVQLSIMGETTLRVEAPEGSLTEVQWEWLAKKKPILIEYLQKKRAVETSNTTASKEETCAHCKNTVEYYSDTGVPSCKHHRLLISEQQCATLPALKRITQTDFFLQDIEEIQQCLSREKKPICLDLETTGLKAHKEKIISLALGRPGQVFLLDLRPYYGLSAEWQAQWRYALRTLLQQADVTWVGHNLKFDAGFLQVHFGIQLCKMYDTMLVEQLIHGVGLLDPDVPVNLQAVATRYRLPVRKEARQWFAGLDLRPEEWAAPFPPEQLAYMIQDIQVPYQIGQLQQKQLQKNDLKRIVAIENQAIPAITALEQRGVLIDQTLWREILATKYERQLHLEAELTELLSTAFSNKGPQRSSSYQQTMVAWDEVSPRPPRGPEINLKSSVQLLKGLNAMGIEVSSTSEDTLEPLAGTFPVIAKLLQWKKLQKFRSAFGENLLEMIDSDGRLRCDYAQIGALSGRIICSRPNLQQIPSKEKNEDENIRRCFIAPPGHKLLKADLSNIELRILAEVANDETLLRMFAEGADLHEETARLMFNLPPETDTRKHLYKGQYPARALAKTINYGLAYGMGARGLANRAGIPEDVAKQLMETYFQTYSGIARWLRITAQQTLRRGYGVTLAGRRRPFIVNEKTDRATRASMERSAKNHPIQGTNADIMKRMLHLLQKNLPSEVTLVLAVHDEVVLECPDHLLEPAEQILKQAMEQACRDFLKVVHIPEAEVLIDEYWRKE
ncbi:DNA polymerase [Tengunoibacter tsumagoiensis]|uniref:DNA polymerase I n=1 Tax=Tengunoibacter tsumagoiensis TaxID=2014871 RepID=A0A402A819_9CHLR|nr:DNA polymerase [Tengunoibacter tsumagoiensis]GCE15304.1 bifunctional 3'-5' exonuclease/DNA polymerase [Tengunoibacter tsumagoiensis]